MIKGRLLNELLNLGSKHTLFFHKGDWYHNLNKFPGVLADLNGYVKFETKKEYLSNVKLKHGVTLHVKEGIKSLKNYKKFSEEQLYLINQIASRSPNLKDDQEINSQAERRPRNIDSIVRNRNLVRSVKDLRNNKCQLCGLKLKIGENSYYSEIHHIQPLGTPHNGPDIKSNMLCVCPNCHIKLDYGFIALGNDFINLPEHTINPKFIQYHNSKVSKSIINTDNS